MKKNIKIVVLPKRKIHNIENALTEKHSIISVYTPFSEPANILKNKNTEKILFTSFDDYDTIINNHEEFWGRKQILFSAVNAKEIIDFWNEINSDLLIVHCEAGVSRSPAIAAALTKINEEDDNFYFKNYRPNSLVYRTILNYHFSNL